MVITKHEQAEWIEESIVETVSGSERFGHTGKK